jgi:hypothetical protein
MVRLRGESSEPVNQIRVQSESSNFFQRDDLSPRRQNRNTAPHLIFR